MFPPFSPYLHKEVILMKCCSKCNIDKDIEEFRWKSKAKGIRHARCKDCMKAVEKKYYDTNPNRKQAVRDRALKTFNENVAFLEEYKSNLKCLKCGEDKPYMLDLHHVNADDKVDVVYNLVKGHSLKKIKEELEKCVPLCANHHREFHYLEKSKGITLEDYLK
jgi:hypothetical protein